MILGRAHWYVVCIVSQSGELKNAVPDLPELVRTAYKNNISAFDLHERMPAHVDIPRIRKGRVGGFFWSVYVDCKVSSSNRYNDTIRFLIVFVHRMMDRIFLCLPTALGQLPFFFVS